MKLDLPQLSKIATLFFGLMVVLFFDEVLILTESPISLLLSLFTESFVVSSALSPFGAFSVLSAQYILSQGLYAYIFIGFLISISAHFLSFWIGKKATKKELNKHYPSLLTLVLTFSSPQFAALTAFESGIENYSWKRYMQMAIPIYAIWFAAACFIILYAPIDLRDQKVAYFGFVFLVGWILLPYVKDFFQKKQNL